MAKRTDKAKWIWIATECHSEDCYLRARRTFTLSGAPADATLRVTARSGYVLYVNGRYVGCGPTPSSASAPLLDVYTADDLPLKRGRNVVAVLAHNYHVGLPRLPRLPAGLWLQLDVTGAGGKTERVGTNKQWRVSVAEDFSRRAPRVYWTTGFTEVRDTRREPQGWTEAGFSDRRWAKADEIRWERPTGAPPQTLRERTTPRLTETFVAPARLASSGWAKWQPGMTAIPFEFAVPSPTHGEFYAGTFVRSHRRQKVRLAFDCDEAAAIYFNNRQVVRQGYSEWFVHWLQDEEHDHYTGIHRGQGHRTESAEVTLGTGWNSIGIVIYDPGRSWGFAMRLEDARTGKTLPLEFSPDLKAGDWVNWQIVIDQLCPCGKGSLPEVPAPNGRTFPDPAYQLAWEKRTATRRAPPGAASLATGGKGRGPLRLRDGETVTYDFGDEVVGHTELEVEGTPGAILDVAWGEALGHDGRLEPVRSGMRHVDRLILRGGRQTVRFVNRRALRYIELVARTGGDRLKVHRLGFHATGRGTDPPAAFDTRDRQLADALVVVERTVHRCLQRTFEGSPARDAEQSVPAAYLLAQAERTLYGRTDLGEAALRAFADDQRDDGFFRSVVPSGTVHTVPDWNLLWIVWMADHVAWTGDRPLAKRLYPVAEKCLEWTAAYRGSSGLLENKPRRSPWWLFLDHSPIDKRGEVTAWQALWHRRGRVPRRRRGRRPRAGRGRRRCRDGTQAAVEQGAGPVRRRAAVRDRLGRLHPRHQLLRPVRGAADTTPGRANPGEPLEERPGPIGRVGTVREPLRQDLRPRDASGTRSRRPGDRHDPFLLGRHGQAGPADRAGGVPDVGRRPRQARQERLDRRALRRPAPVGLLPRLRRGAGGARGQVDSGGAAGGAGLQAAAPGADAGHPAAHQRPRLDAEGAGGGGDRARARPPDDPRASARRPALPAGPPAPGLWRRG